MKSKSHTVLSLFSGDRQYRVPFFQRRYTWKQSEQWDPLWEDIRSKAQLRLDGVKGSPHFLGAVVMEPHVSGIDEMRSFDVIDGQQRLTTLQYVLAALGVAHNELKIAVPPSVLKCLANTGDDVQSEEDAYKVWPTFTDRAHHLKTLGAHSMGEMWKAYPAHFTQRGTLLVHDASRPLSLGAVMFFASSFQEWMTSDSRNPVAAGEAIASAILEDMQLVCLTLESWDDPQVIFETLNGRGAKLTAVDLIRNLIFMRADQDEDADPHALYSEHWLSFEGPEWTGEERRGRLKKTRLEWMIRSMLEAVTGHEVDQQRLYNDYKDFVVRGDVPKSAEQQLMLLKEIGMHYQALVAGTGSSPIGRFGHRANAYEASTVYPLALKIAISGLSADEQRRMYQDLLSYLVRRAVCGLTTKNYNLLFLGALKHISGDDVMSPARLRDYLASSMSDTTRWPRDDEFRAALVSAPLYHGNLDAPRVRQLLTEIEGALRLGQKTEEPDVPSLTHLDIDHIMPRSWHTHWPLPDDLSVTPKEMDAAKAAQRDGLELSATQDAILVREGLVNTLGNLTLLNLSVNRSAQHHSFPFKRDQLIKHTNLSLNIHLLVLPEWDNVRIRERSEKLASIALQLYPGPTTRSEVS
ncbi:DUF262 domain-containing HNH endonuclease family protein [Stenotrophomonas maltophilia]